MKDDGLAQTQNAASQSVGLEAQNQRVVALASNGTAHRKFQMRHTRGVWVDNKGVTAVLEKWAMSKKKEPGFKFLVEHGQHDLTDEWLVLVHEKGLFTGSSRRSAAKFSAKTLGRNVSRPPRYSGTNGT